MTEFVSGITPVRQVALFHLQYNPRNIKQILGTLEDASGAMCAAGVACNALEINNNGAEPQRVLAKMMEMPDSHVSSIFTLNDDRRLTLEQCALVLHDYFLQTGTWSTIKSPTQVYDENKSKYKVVK